MKEEILNMCASGKDRTGLAEHDQSAQAIASHLVKSDPEKSKSAEVANLDAQLLRSGHTAGQAGGIYAGGATVGCYGTKSENKAGLPKSRKKGLIGIIERAAQSNKIKGKSKLKEPKRTKTTAPTLKKEGRASITKESARLRQSVSIKPTDTPQVQSSGNENTKTR